MFSGMMDDENKAELIDRYLDQELSPAEKTLFEQSLKNDTELKLEVEAQNAVRNMIILQGEKAALSKMFDAFHHQMETPETLAEENHDSKIVVPDAESDKKRRSKKIFEIQWGNWSYMAVAASVALTIIGFWTVFKDRSVFDDQMEIRNNADDEAFRIPFLTWRTVENKPVLQDRKFIDLKITRKTENKFHYRFKSFLEIYSDSLTGKNDKITLQYDQDSGVYKLWIGKRIYIIGKTDTIRPLE
jgi:hypothetical protein